MNFRPADPKRHLWDTWFYDHEGLYFLYYLSNPVSDDGKWQPWDAFSLAVSRDLLHWEEKGEVFRKSDNPDDWDGRIITTGDITKWDGRWYMTYRATEERIEKCGIIVSDDLFHWSRIRREPILPPCPPYENDPSETVNGYVEMRDVTLSELPDGTVEALFTARIARGPHTGRGVIGKAVSPNMTDWEYGEPVFEPGKFNVIEVPSRFDHAGRRYLLYCVNRFLESDLEDPRYPSLRWCTAYALADESGRFVWAPGKVLLAGDAYVGRLVRIGGETLFLHHLCSKRPAFGLPKAASFDGDGNISLGYWDGTDALLRGPVIEGFRGLVMGESNGKPVCAGTVTNGKVMLENRGGFGDAWLDPVCSDFLLDVSVDFGSCGSAGLILNGDAGSREGVMLTLHREHGSLRVGRSKKTYGHLAPAEVRHEYVDESLTRGMAEIRVVSRSEGFDWYVNGRHVLATVDEDYRSGRIGLFVREGRAAFTGLTVRRLEEE